MCQVLLLFILALGVLPGWGFQRLGPLRPRLQLLQQTQPGQPRLAVTMGMSLPHMRISSVGEGQSKGKARLMLQYLWRGAVSLGKFLLPIVLPSIVAYLLGVPPAMAAKRKGKRSNSASGTALEAAAAAATAGAAAAGATATVVKKQKRSIFRKILQGVNSADSSSILKGAGDTRGEVAGILNAFSSVFILSGLFFFAFLVHKRREAKMYRAMTAEVSKIREYKENMYFEAVQGILERLADPKLKGSTKANLQKELKALDPDGIIKKFIEDKGERPDISYLIDRKKKSKKDDKFSAIAERPKGKKRPPGGTAASSKSSKSTSPSTEDLDLRDDGDGDGDNEETAAPAPLPAEKAKSPSRPVPRASAEDDGNDDEGASGGRKPPTPTRPPAYLTVLKELSESLEESALSASARKQLLDLLKSKIEAVSDVAKMDAVVSKIAAKLGDIEYWEGYYEKSFS